MPAKTEHARGGRQVAAVIPEYDLRTGSNDRLECIPQAVIERAGTLGERLVLLNASADTLKRMSRAVWRTAS